MVDDIVKKHNAPPWHTFSRIQLLAIIVAQKVKINKHCRRACFQNSFSGAGRKNGSHRILIVNSRIAGRCIRPRTCAPIIPDHSKSFDGGRVGVWGRVMCSVSLLRCPISSSALNSLRQLSTAATRSARFLCHRQRSHRSPQPLSLVRF